MRLIPITGARVVKPHGTIVYSLKLSIPERITTLHFNAMIGTSSSLMILLEISNLI